MEEKGAGEESYKKLKIMPNIGKNIFTYGGL